MKNIRLKYRLILPIALLGIVVLISNALAVINIHNVNSNAANIADNLMSGKSRLAEISESAMNIHNLALSHIVATDYNTMITVVNEIKEEEALLDNMLLEYEGFVTEEDRKEYYAALEAWDTGQDLVPLRNFLKSQTEKTWEKQIAKSERKTLKSNKNSEKP